MLKTATPRSMKLNSLGVVLHKFILGPISQVLTMCTVCEQAHDNWVCRVTTGRLRASSFQDANWLLVGSERLNLKNRTKIKHQLIQILDQILYILWKFEVTSTRITNIVGLLCDRPQSEQNWSLQSSNRHEHSSLCLTLLIMGWCNTRQVHLICLATASMVVTPAAHF